MEYYTMTNERNAHLRTAVRREMTRSAAQGAPVTAVQALRRVLARPVTGGYFVNTDRAVRICARMEQGEEPMERKERISRLCREKWQEIATKVHERRLNKGEELCRAVYHVLSTATASSYFISYATARRIVFTTQPR